MAAGNSRKVVLDTETTGFLETLNIDIKDPKQQGIIEIGCVELINGMRTGNNFHCYINPECDVDEAAFKVHGISQAFLNDKPVFKEIAGQLVDYLKGAELIIHNAPFDIGFLNYELQRLDGQFGLITDNCTVFDTLVFARKKHIGQKNSLDALCKRYGIDNTGRDLHGALLDAQLLADVYLAMKMGQANLFMGAMGMDDDTSMLASKTVQSNKRHQLRIIKANKKELAAHHAFIEKLLTTQANE